jgi:tetratricopeptide (TPR) repeat protein
MLLTVLDHDASRLFLDRARSALPSFTVTISNATAIAEICRRLDGIPLAIELAAARVRAISPEQIASRLDHDFHLLTSGSRTALPRQQTLKATLDWSHNLLSDQERALLRRLSVFVGGFSLEAAEGVSAGDEIEEIEVVDLLAKLVDKSLVEAETREGDLRYRLLEPVRQYAWHRLEESGETERVQRRHATWFERRFHAVSDDIGGPEEARWQSMAARDLDNVRAALHWSFARDPTTGLTLAASTQRYWQSHGFRGESRRWLDEMILRAPERTLDRAWALFQVAAYAMTEGDFERSIPLASESVAIYRELDYELDMGNPLNMLGQAAYLLGDHARARYYLEQAEALGRKQDNMGSLAETLDYLSYDAWLAGENERMRGYLTEAWTTSNATGSPFEIGYTHYLLGGLACTEGDYLTARAHIEAGVEAYRSIGNAPSAGWCLCMLGYVALCEGEIAEARIHLLEGLRLTARAAQKSRMCLRLAFLSLMTVREGDADRGARLAGAAEGLSRHLRTFSPPDQLADLDACLAAARSALGEVAFARAWSEGQGMTLDQAFECALTAEADG